MGDYLVVGVHSDGEYRFFDMQNLKPMSLVL